MIFSVAASPTAIFLQTIFDKIVSIGNAVFIYKEMFWMLTPLFITMFLMEIYFAKYKREELGWNTAFGNALVLIFVAIDLTRYLYVHFPLFLESGLFLDIFLKGIVVFFVFVFGILLTVIDFYHFLPKSIAFKVSGRLPLNFFAMMAIILVYSNIKLDLWFVIAALIIFLILAIIITGIHHIVGTHHVKEDY